VGTTVLEQPSKQQVDKHQPEMTDVPRSFHAGVIKNELLNSFTRDLRLWRRWPWGWYFVVGHKFINVSTLKIEAARSCENRWISEYIYSLTRRR